LTRLSDVLAHAYKPAKSDLGFQADLLDKDALLRSAGVKKSTLEENHQDFEAVLQETHLFSDLA
jgi:hypothetical protein